MKTALILWYTFFLLGEFRTEICRSCDKVSNVNECASSVTCGKNQICFMERNVTAQIKALYSGGCRARNAAKIQINSYNAFRHYVVQKKKNGYTVNLSSERYWKYNGIDFDPSGIDGAIVQVPNEGTLRFAMYQEKYEGKYQCFANNGYGVSASRIFKIKTAKFNNFQHVPQMIHRAQAGSSVTLPCYPPISLPGAGLQWVLMDINDTWQNVHDSEQIMMDTDGRLRFLNVMKSDEQNGRTYRCMANNSVTRQHSFGPEHMLDVVGDERRSPASYMWFSPTWQIFRRTETLELTCIFSGNPTPVVYWRKPDGSSFSNRTTFTSYGRQLRITDVDYSDAGQYECFGINSETAVGLTRQFDVIIEATPYWKVKPKDIEAVVGETATFFSLVDGVPSPSYNWYINGIPLEESKDPRIYHNPRLSQPAQNNLTLAGLTLADHMNIQCNVSNKHGYIFADVYLNVLP